MNFLDYIILAVVGWGFIAAIIHMRRRKRFSGCTGCSGCSSSCKQCNSNNKID